MDRAIELLLERIDRLIGDLETAWDELHNGYNTSELRAHQADYDTLRERLSSIM